MATKKTEEKVVAKDKEHLEKLIEAAIKKNGVKCDLNFIDVSKVQNMSQMFALSKFNGDISQWDVSNVNNMSYMFNGSSFNGDISKWDVSNVTNMSYMFGYSQFNGDISKWDVSNVTDMNNMFDGSSFNGDISKWDVSNVTNMSYMFECSQFNGDISNWNVSNVTNMSNMFAGSQFNGDISNWNVSNVTNMSNMFTDSQFNGDISNWNVSNVTDMSFMFEAGKNFMFGRSQFNGNISNWDVSNVTNMSFMFGRSQFNGDISNWNVSKVTNMQGMFAESIFNGDISNWNVSNVTDMDYMFARSQFNGDISKWDVSKVKNKKVIFSDSLLEKSDNLPKGVSKSKNASQKKPSTKKPENLFMLNTITMSDAQIKKFNSIYNEKNIPEIFGKKGAALNKILSGKTTFKTAKTPPIEVYKDMAEKGLEFNIHWEGTEFTELESWGVGNGNAKGGNFWYCIDFNETRAKFIEDYDQDWNPQSSEFVEHMDEYGNNCEIKKFQVAVHGNNQQEIFALPVKKLLESNKSIEKGLVVFKIPYYLEGNYDSAGRSCNDFSDDLRCTPKDSKKELYLLDKKGQKVKSILDFDHSEPDKNGDVYYPVPASDFEKKSKNKTLTQEAVAKWKKLLGMK